VSNSPQVVASALEAASPLAQFFERLPVGCYTCDLSGTITAYNPRAVELWGREPQPNDRFTAALKILDARGDAMPPEATPTAFLIRCGISARNQEAVIERPDGKRVIVLVSVTPLLDHDDRVVGALTVLQDITDRRRSEEARRVAERLSAYARVGSEVTQQLQPALLSVVKLLDCLGQEASLSTAVRAEAALVRHELVHLDGLARQMAHLAGAA
jgi:PAS fold